MKLILGIDEAGYGPNLGPLVIACTAWFCRSNEDVSQWGELLKPEFSTKFTRGQDAPIALGDSKQIYVGRNKLEALDRTVGFFANRLHPDNILLSSRGDLINALDAEFETQIVDAPWLSSDNLNSEHVAASDLIHSRLREQSLLKMDGVGIRFLNVQLRIISEPVFNRLVGEHGNKASLLTHESLRLAKAMLARIFAEEAAVFMATPLDGIEVYFDKHGGRSKYVGALTNCWPDWYFQVQEEARMMSSYSVQPSDVPKTFRFVAGGDRLIPCGLASIFAKWAREMLMMRLNTFWETRVPGIRPTAGYPQDAKRFSQEIEAVAFGLNLMRNQWWRVV